MVSAAGLHFANFGGLQMLCTRNALTFFENELSETLENLESVFDLVSCVLAADFWAPV